ncbi:putative Heat stress transcription factor B-4b [Quillaja saponaria]|uniref:Heat stress transcription factor B-4b n=1 Tax=Quillaja saponaria TaxID=32244 RepID=A0AAD7QIC1_QUISA|nr:putative Heat stress transcription factor B-4b [Quillaja saponaria]
MASLGCENLVCINGEDEFNNLEVMEMDGDLLKSLLEESQIDERDEDQLNNLIRSLEAEIKVDDHDITMQTEEVVSNFGEGISSDQSWNIGQMDGQDCSISHNFDHDFAWIDMDVVPSLPSDDMIWYMDTYGSEMDGIIEFISEDENYSKFSYGSDLGEYGYTSLWQETYLYEVVQSSY